MQGDAVARAFSFLGLILVISAALTLFLPDGAEGKEVEYPSYAAVLLTYEQETGVYGNLSVGDRALFRERVITAVYHEGETIGRTTVWVGSIGAGEGLPSLNYPIDLTSDLKTDAEVRFTVLVEADPSRGNGSQKLTPLFGDGSIVILEEGRDDGPIGKEDIEVFGIKIRTNFLPEEYRTPFVRFLFVFVIWGLASAAIVGLMIIGSKLAKKTKTDLDEKVLKIISGPFFVILILYGLLISLSQLDLSSRLIEILDIAYRAVSIVVIAYIILKVFRNVLVVYLKMVSKRTETQADDVLLPVFGKIATVVIWIGAGIMFLKVFGIDITVFLGAMGIAGLVIAFAAQDTLSNFFSGIMILLDRPFKEGDWIELNGSNYQVKHIGLRSTRLLHAISNQLVTIPNNRISDHMFSNLSEPDFLGRKTVEIGVSYDNNPNKVGRILIEIANSHPDTYLDTDHTPFYRFSAFGDSSLNFSLTFWVKDFNEQWRVASEIRERIYERFEKEGIEIPFPQRVVHMGRKKGASPDIPDPRMEQRSMDMQNLNP